MAKPIDLSEKFPHLSKAPIVEAVLDIRVVPSVKWDEAGLQKGIKRADFLTSLNWKPYGLHNFRFN